MNKLEKIDRKIELMKQYQEELDKRNQIYAEFERLVICGEHEKAQALLKTLDDQTCDQISSEINRLDQEEEKEEDALVEACVRIGLVIGDFLVDFTSDMLAETLTVNEQRLVRTCQAYAKGLSDLKSRK